MQPSEWIQLDTSQLNKPRREKAGNLEINVFASPYDVPEAVRGYYDEEERRFTIEFKYMGESEQLVSDAQHEGVNLKIGRHSRRLYRIEIDTEALKAKTIELNVHVNKAIEDLSKKQHSLHATTNYEMTKRVMSERGSQLFQSWVES